MKYPSICINEVHGERNDRKNGLFRKAVRVNTSLCTTIAKNSENIAITAFVTLLQPCLEELRELI